ncbi:MAG: EAL domain-containing protein [Lachnospira sp.]
MQDFFAGFIVILILCNLLLFVYTKKKSETESIRRLRFTTFGLIWMMITEIMVLFVRNRQHAFLAFALFYMAFAWFNYSIFRFCMAYTGYNNRSFYKTPAFWMTIAESGLFIWGVFSQDLFTITHIRWFNNSVWITRRFPMFYCYTLVSVIVIISALVVLITAARKSAKIYRLKYTSVLIVIVAEVAFYVFAEVREIPMFVAVSAIGVGEIITIYMAVFYSQKKLLQKALLFVADELNDGIVLYNEEHRLQFVTDGYCIAMGVQDEAELSDEKNYWEKILEDTTVDIMWNGRIKEIVRNERKYYYDIQFKTFDEDGKSVGTVYWIKDITEAISNYDKMLFRANYDELTGIYNEAHFQEECRTLIDDNPDTEFVMTCSCVDKYKMFTDLFGKEHAYRFCRRMAEAVKKNFGDNSLCRYGRSHDDIFYVMMPKAFFNEEMCATVIDSVTKQFDTSNYKLVVKIGVYEIEDKSLNISAMCNRASISADAARGDYSKQIVYFDEKVQNDALLEEKLNAELSSAIENGDIKIYLHPQMNDEGRVIGAEALARWEHKELGIIPPVCFIPAFENNGRITELDICIWRQACEKLKEWKDNGHEDLYLSVNISAKDLYALNIYEHYVGLVKEYDINPHNLKLEITESAIINDLQQHVALIDRLQEAGFEVEMDDFGSAYSSFNMLKDICVDVLKIDMKFLGDTENIVRSRTILKSIVDLSKKLDMRTVAEGVETDEQFEFLKNVGCDIYQGYYFAKPMSTHDFEAKYLS